MRIFIHWVSSYAEAADGDVLAADSRGNTGQYQTRLT